MELTSKNLLNIIKAHGAVYETHLLKTFGTTEKVEDSLNIVREAVKLMRLKLIDLEFDDKGNRIYTIINRTIN